MALTRVPSYLIASSNGGTGRDTEAAVGVAPAAPTLTGIAAAITVLRASAGGQLALPAISASFASPVEVVGEFTNGLVVAGGKSTITGTSASADGLLVGNKVGQIAGSYFNKFAVRDLSVVGPGTVGTAAGVRQQAAADVVMENIRTRNWPVGLMIDGGLTSDYINLSVTDNGIGIQARLFDDGITDSTPEGLNSFSPNANSFYGARVYHNDNQAVKYDNNPSGCANWIGCNFEGNNTDGNSTDGVRVIEMTEAGHHNFIGTHHESNAGQYSMYYEGADDSKVLLLAGVENIDATGTNVHIQRGRLSSIGSRLTNASSTHDVFLNTGARATLIDTECTLSGDTSYVAALRDGRLAFGIQPVGSSPVIDMQPAPIVAALNIAQNWRNDTVQLRFQNTAGTRVGYIQTSAAGNHTAWNDNASGGWAFGAGNATRFYVGRGGADSIEPGAATTDCGTPTLPWNGVFSKRVRTIGSLVSALPTAASAGAGARAFVTDATLRTFDSVVVGGGANAMPVWSDGTNWRIG